MKQLLVILKSGFFNVIRFNICKRITNFRTGHVSNEDEKRTGVEMALFRKKTRKNSHK